jgi:hypothetical protein
MEVETSCGDGVRKETPVDAIASLEENRRINESVENRLTRNFVDAEAPLALWNGQLQLGYLQEFALDSHHKLLDPATRAVERKVFSHAADRATRMPHCPIPPRRIDGQ